MINTGIFKLLKGQLHLYLLCQLFVAADRLNCPLACYMVWYIKGSIGKISTQLFPPLIQDYSEAGQTRDNFQSISTTLEPLGIANTIVSNLSMQSTITEFVRPTEFGWFGYSQIDSKLTSSI